MRRIERARAALGCRFVAGRDAGLLVRWRKNREKGGPAERERNRSIIKSP